MNTHPTRYHRALVVLHWLLAVLLIDYANSPFPNLTPQNDDGFVLSDGHRVTAGLLDLKRKLTGAYVTQADSEQEFKK